MFFVTKIKKKEPKMKIWQQTILKSVDFEVKRMKYSILYVNYLNILSYPVHKIFYDRIYYRVKIWKT